MMGIQTLSRRTVGVRSPSDISFRSPTKHFKFAILLRNTSEGSTLLGQSMLIPKRELHCGNNIGNCSTMGIDCNYKAKRFNFNIAFKSIKERQYPILRYCKLLFSSSIPSKFLSFD